MEGVPRQERSELQGFVGSCQFAGTLLPSLFCPFISFFIPPFIKYGEFMGSLCTFVQKHFYVKS